MKTDNFISKHYILKHKKSKIFIQFHFYLENAIFPLALEQETNVHVFFVQTLFRQLFSSYTYVEKAAEMTFVQKIHT
jgi:hypothetical protein